MSMADKPTISATELKCADCGYDLRGLTTDGHCPECGLSIVESLTTRRSFTRHQLAVLACRVLALWVLVHIGLHLANFAQAMLWTIGLNGWATVPFQSMLLRLLAASVPLLANVAVAAVLWFLAPWIARRIFSENAPVRIGGPAGVWDILPLAPLGVGVVFIALGVKSIVYVIGAIGSNVSFDDQIPQILNAGSHLLVGAILLLGGPRIVQGIKWLQTAGQTTGAP
ncbi:MAG: hypothetical protein WD534_12405 [Phycisphaeraceae bacterium]